MPAKMHRSTGTIFAAMAVTVMAASGCSGMETDGGSTDTPATEVPVTEQTRSVTGTPAAEPRDRGPLVTRIKTNDDGAPGSMTVEGLTTDSEALEFEVACDREDTIRVEVARIGFVQMTCPMTEGLTHTTTMDISGLEQDITTGERELQITATGTEGTVWEVAVTKADRA